MAEHVRNALARAHVAIRPSRILTLAKFIEPFTPYAETPDSLLHLLIARLGPPSEFRSYHRALAALVGQVPDLPSSYSDLLETLEAHLAQQGKALREKRLKTAIPITTGPIILDGFFTLTPGELDLLRKLPGVTVTLPTWPGSTSARDHLLSQGFAEQRLDTPLRNPSRKVIAAPTQEQEAEHITRTILEQAAQGRQFREMGVILRVRDPYASALESTFARFGIPARFHFSDPLSAHPAIQYLSGIIQSLLSGWDHADLLPLLRMPVSGVGATPEGDILDFQLRQSLPNRGLQFFCGSANFGGSGPFRPLLALTAVHLTPVEWSTRLKTLRTLIPPQEIPELWRSTVAAINAFDQALDTTAEALPDDEIPLSKFWPNVETAVSIEKLRIPDHRRNVVNVMDVYEARQWELPIVFVPGLNERHFPQYHRENPLLPDPSHTTERQQEEHFLFDLASTRATEQTILSYARFNEKGDPQLRSFFLPEEGEPSSPLRILPLKHPVGQVPDLSPANPKAPTTLSPTAIETFLQCPFQFFAQKTLRLRKRPEKPRDRLNALIQGSILHKALAEGNLDRVFEEECKKNNIPRTYRREAVRLELLRHFEAFHCDKTWPLDWPRQTELEFLIPLTPALSIRGRIDRLDLGPDNQAIVIDYKYSAAAKIRERVEGDPVQGGLYSLAAERVFNRTPSGMFYCGLRQSVSWEGWHANIAGLRLGESRTTMRELIDAAEHKAKEVHEQILAGNKQVRPADRAKCRYCDYRDMCRIESISIAVRAAP